jgi:hypothetical protein
MGPGTAAEIVSCFARSGSPGNKNLEAATPLLFPAAPQSTRRTVIRHLSEEGHSFQSSEHSSTPAVAASVLSIGSSCGTSDDLYPDAESASFLQHSPQVREALGATSEYDRQHDTQQGPKFRAHPLEVPTPPSCCNATVQRPINGCAVVVYMCYDEVAGSIAAY